MVFALTSTVWPLTTTSGVIIGSTVTFVKATVASRALPDLGGVAQAKNPAINMSINPIPDDLSMRISQRVEDAERAVQ